MRALRDGRRAALGVAGWRRREGKGAQPVEMAAPGDFAVEFADRETVRRLLARLEPLHREALWLRFYRDLSYEEIAAVGGKLIHFYTSHTAVFESASDRHPGSWSCG